MKKNQILTGFFIIMIAFTVLSTGCSMLPTWAGGEDKKQAAAPPPPKTDINGQPLVKFSDNQLTMNPSNRVYRRMSRSRLEEESEVHSQAGSMWVMEGQGAYLFTQNKVRREGDVLNIRLEGAGQKQVETKVSVIKKLLKQLEDQMKPETPANAEGTQTLAQGGGSSTDANRAPAAAPKVNTATNEPEEPLDIGEIPLRITERLADGNYRVKGQQPFMIGKREYKVIVAGVIRPEDYNDQGISSSKLIESQYDVVSLRRREP